MKVADIYDFDGTLTNTDTTKIMLFSLFLTNPIASIKSLFALNLKNKKKIGATFLQGKKISNLTLFIFRFLTKLTIRDWLISKIEKTEYKKKVIVLSASFEPFIKNFFDHYYPKLNIDICATKVVVEKNIVKQISISNRGKAKSMLLKNDYTFYEFDEAWGNEIDDLFFLKLAKKQFFIMNSNKILNDSRLNNCSIYDSYGKKIVRYRSG